MAKTLTKNNLLSSQSLSAGSTVRATADLQDYDMGAVLTWAITNGATGPTVQCEARILVSHVSTGDSTPSSAAEGTGDTGWKTVSKTGGGTTNSAKTTGYHVFHPGVGAAEIEFTGNTGQSVTVEAHLTAVTGS